MHNARLPGSRGTAAGSVFFHHKTLLAISLSALATCASADEPVALDDLVVTTGLEPMVAEDVSGSLTVITREEIERRQVKFLSELLRTVPGFAVNRAGGPGALTQVRVRGAEANQLLVLVDGIRANDPASGDEFQFQYALTADIERIEIVRGPQSAIWGTDALAGVINIIRRKDIAPDSGYLKSNAEGGSFGSFTAGVEGGMQRGRATFSGGVNYLESDGTNISLQGDEKDGTENTTADARLDFDLNDAWRLTLTGELVDARSDFDGVSFITGLPEDSDQYTEIDRTYASAGLFYNPGGGRWDASATVNWLDSDNQNYSFGAWESSTAADTLEYRLRASLGLGASPEDHRLSFALDHRDVDFEQRGQASDFGDPNQDQSYDVTGYAAEYLGRPTDSLSWSLSVRQDDYSDFDDATTWQTGASYRWDSGVRLRGSVGTGSKAPTFIERFGFFPDFFLGNPDLEPETSMGWELGIDLPIGAQGAELGITWFDQTLEDEIDGFVFDPATFFFTAANRDGKSERQGLELTLFAPITGGLSVQGAYTYTDAEEFAADGSLAPELRRPEHMASLVLNQVFAEGRGNLNLSASYNGSQLDNYFPPPNYSQIVVELDGYTLVDFAASWAITPSLELTGRVTNLLDEDYEEVLGFASAGRGWFVGIRGQLSR